jgi:pimeloyl-ACP methyl ester carboxylesterase
MAMSVVAEYRWIETGEGPPVVFLHGLFGTNEHWEPTLHALGSTHRALALALPIFELPPDDLSVAGLRRHVEGFLEAERLGPAVVVGNSLGGHVALDLALHAPARVRALVLAGSSGLLERSFTRGVPHRPSAAFVREKMAEVFHDPSLVTPQWVDAIRDALGRRSYALRVLRVSRSARRYNLEARLGEIRCPTLLVWGLEDRITPREVALRFLQGLPQATLRLIPECGHAPMIERPETFSPFLAEVLDRLPPVAVATARA